MTTLPERFKNFLKTSNLSHKFIAANKEELTLLMKYYNLDINKLSSTEIRFLTVNYPYDLKCPHCNNNKKIGRNKYYPTCGELKCARKEANLTTFKRFGVYNASQADIIKIKKEETCFKNHGVKNPNHSHEVILKNKQTYQKNNRQNYKFLNKEYIESNFILEDNTIDINSFIKFFNYSNDCAPYKVLKALNVSFNKRIRKSLAEIEIQKFIESNNIPVITNERNILKPFEIDIFIPEYNIGIEFNGLYYHSYSDNISSNISEKQSDKQFQQNRHLEKTLKFEALSKDHKLFHIFENEWINPIKQDIWKSMLSNSLGKSRSVYARKCIVKELDSKISNKFIEDNHIQGIRNSKVKLGLYYDNELISVMTFGKPLDTNSIYEYELIRFCNKKYINVIGGASKLLKYFEINYKPKSLISYTNRRWSKGDLYHKLGFTLNNISNPNKFIIKGNKLYTSDKNIYNYRILYDCGEYEFLKLYH